MITHGFVSDLYVVKHGAEDWEYVRNTKPDRARVPNIGVISVPSKVCNSWHVALCCGLSLV